MNIRYLQSRLREAREKTGGRYEMTFYGEGDDHAEAHIIHRWRPHLCANEQYKAVAVGTVPDCLDGLDHYVATYPLHGPRTMVDADLGLMPVCPIRVAAE